VLLDWLVAVWNVVHVAAAAQRDDADYLAALENETTTLQKRVDACRSRIMFVTCFDVTVWLLQPAAAADARTLTCDRTTCNYRIGPYQTTSDFKWAPERLDLEIGCFVGRLGSGPHLVGLIGLGVRVSASCQKKISRLMGPTQPAHAPHRCTKCNSPPVNGHCTNHRIAVLWGFIMCPLKG